MSDKMMPDKAIDAMDEAGAKVHVNRIIETPKKIQDLEKKIKKATDEKEKCVGEQKFELAAEKRDIERELTKELNIEKEVSSIDEQMKRVLSLLQDIKSNKRD